jgi:hypothetical protein
VGTLVYKIQEKKILCNGNIEWTSLEFYEHVLLIREKVRWCCLPETYYAEALPRFKIVNVTFTNGKRNLIYWLLLLVLVGVCLLTLGINGENVTMAVIGVILLLLAPVPFFLCRKWRYVTFDIRGLSTGRWFSLAKTYTFRFRKERPNEAFFIDYIFSPLRKGRNATHALSHINSVGLAFPLKSYVSSKADFAEEEEEMWLQFAWGKKKEEKEAQEFSIMQLVDDD